jgi:hypothetical protein
MGDNKEEKIPIEVLQQLFNRSNLFSKMLGTDTFSGNRDVYSALGYPKEINATDYWNRYTRQDLAKAIIDRPVKASWKGTIEVIENTEKESTPFEKEWEELYSRLKLKSVFIRADKLTGLGRYSIILLGLNDTKSLEDFRKPVSKKVGLKLMYVKPLSEQSATISELEKNPNSERFGLPLYYDIKVTEEAAGIFTGTSLKVHYTRIIHLVEDLMESEYLGTPRLQAVYNRLIDLEKIVGGDAEMFWRGARPGYTGTVDKDYQMTTKAFDELQKELDDFENNLRRILVNEGVTYKALAQQIADPSSHVDVQIALTCAVTEIPKRILMGSERGELSSAQDKQEWISYVTSRREEKNEPMILRPAIDKFIEIGLLPQPKDPYIVVWDKLFSLSDSEKVTMGRERATALKEYTANPITSEIMPLDLFAELCLAFDPTIVERIMKSANTEILREMVVTPEEQRVIDKESIENKEKTAKNKITPIDKTKRVSGVKKQKLKT